MSEGILHLVLGDIAAGILDDAMSEGALARAPILRFRDIYCVGPLTALDTPRGPASRAAYWGQVLSASPPAVEEFDEEEDRFRQARDSAAAGPTFVWPGAHSSSQLWLRRLCSMLTPLEADLRIVDASEPGNDPRRRRAVSQFEPRELPRLAAHARRAGELELNRLASDWRFNARISSSLRRWTDGRLSHHADDHYDDLLVAQCDFDWQPAEQVIGSAMWDCDEFLGDVFFAWRLRCLIANGRLLRGGPSDEHGEASVRLPGVAPDADGVH